ncbi:Putative xanthine dehydrogenase molybdenum-binding subunit XdhA [Neomoorella glycerini]|uniref:Xanthine dehydrogenase molybdenum-binding subunit XdhA n=1 Tax=Neomoorella glycerini TaxID=55779 RepID=A0A6I5ZMZ1_9FIRM|nr:molybdopterin cofactor-binding domain-containing protein [Moorella glycerini]QGP91216.1 Putative xanthine dehydrogenase molybdenum-binding subunit XdhA [Moorella glycerini]
MKAAAKYQIVGRGISRLDALEKVTGKATYTTDITLPGMLYAKVLRSPHPHARIIKIDTSKAEALPGVKAVLTYRNTPRVPFNAAATSTYTIPPLAAVKDQYLFDDVVRYVGDEVAAVAAVSEEIARAALDLIEVEYEILPAVYDPLEALKPEAPLLHPHCTKKNIAGDILQFGLGDIATGLAAAEIVVEATYKLPVQKQGQLETQAAVAALTGDGKLTIWSPTQTPHPTRRIVAEIFKLPLSKVRVLNPPYVGGGFGVRIGLSAKAEPIAAALALATGRPVKVVYDRQEDFIASDTRHAGYITVKLGLSKDGIFQALYMQAIMNGGAYCSWSADVPGAIGSRGLTIYRVPHSRFEGYSVYTNTTPAGACRGFGAPQPTFAVEMTVAKAAAILGIDPLELRLKNIITPGDTWVAPFPCLSSGLRECLIKGAEKIGWEKRRELAAGHAGSGRYKRGLGVAVGNHISSAFPFQTDYSNVYLSLQPDGTIQLASGVVEMGTGTKTTLAQIAAEVLEVEVEDIAVSLGDTEMVPYDVGSQASRSCYAAGMATLQAARDLKEQILTYASEKWQIPKEKLIWQKATILSRDDPGKQITLKELAADADFHNRQLATIGQNASQNALSWHAHFAEVEVDTATGSIKVIRLVAAHDMGKAINPEIVRGQIQGGAVMGLGYTLGEEITYDPQGRQLQDSYHKYMLPTAVDVPEMETIVVEAGEPTGPFGARGVGENAVAPVAPAVASAVFQATGVHFTELPLTPERVWRALLRPDCAIKN